MNIIIPMAGMGKRMRPHTLTTAKPLIPIAGKPIVQRLVEDIINTSNQKVEKIGFVISPNFSNEVREMLISVAKDLGAEGYIYCQEEALGTAHAILCAKDLLDGNVFVAFADTLFKATFSIDPNRDAIIWTQKVADPSQFGVVIMDDSGKIVEFVEKPKEFVSDLAIIGVYYFRDGDNLKNELQYLIDNNITNSNEYQLTHAIDNMKAKGVAFYTDQVEEWLDCGNKDATVYTNQRILDIKFEKEELIHPSASLKNCTIIPPVYIGPNVTAQNSIIGPFTSLEAEVRVDNSIIENSIIQKSTIINKANIANSLIGNFVQYNGKQSQLSLGDYSTEL